MPWKWGKRLRGGSLACSDACDVCRGVATLVCCFPMDQRNDIGIALALLLVGQPAVPSQARHCSTRRRLNRSSFNYKVCLEKERSQDEN